jgi:HSP20 family protein
MFEILPWKKKARHPEPNKSLDRVFENTLADWFRTPDRWLDQGVMFPKIDVSEGAKHIRIKAEIPGVDADDIDVSIDGGRLHLKGEKTYENKEDNENYHRIEQSYGYFNRSIELPCEVDPEQVDAKFKNGILKLKLKKTKESKPARIEVKSG